MNFLLKHFHRITTGLGFLCWFSAVGTSDFYIIELGEPEPGCVGTLVVIGTVLMTPMVIHLICKYLKGAFE